MSCQQRDKPCTRLTLSSAGCERELDEWPLFLELAALWPRHSLRVCFISTIDSAARLNKQMVTLPAAKAQGQFSYFDNIQVHFTVFTGRDGCRAY